jgi:hypothetical protein
MFNSKRKKKEAILSTYYQVKKGPFYFNSISQYFLKHDHKESLQVISDKTYQDLDLDEVFMYIDRTSSNVGQQYLYNAFRTIPSDNKRSQRFENLITQLNKNTRLKKLVVLSLARLQDQDAYYIASLFQVDHLTKPKWFWIVPLLSAGSIFSILLSFVFPQFLLLLLLFLTVNFIIHYWNRLRFNQYSGAILQLLILKEVASKFIKWPNLIDNISEMKRAVKTIRNIGFQLSIFKLEAKLQSDIGQMIEFLVDIVKALFLIEPLLFYDVLKKFDSRRREIHRLYQLIGELDVALSIDALRKDLPYYTLPGLVHEANQITAKDLYHPLLQNSVANSIDNQGKSILLSGSNMSGKTTFIRTIGINALVAQTINTCFATELSLPRLKIFSAIRISDDIMNSKSYYFEEMLTIKEMLDESRSGNQNLFLLDEMFKGTNTIERVAAGKAVLSYLSDEKNIVFISTHDLELAAYLKNSFHLYHFSEVIQDQEIKFDYKLKSGQLKTTNAIKILELNHYPTSIITEAKKLSDDLRKIKE